LPANFKFYPNSPTENFIKADTLGETAETKEGENGVYNYVFCF